MHGKIFLSSLKTLASMMPSLSNILNVIFAFSVPYLEVRPDITASAVCMSLRNFSSFIARRQFEYFILLCLKACFEFDQ